MDKLSYGLGLGIGQQLAQMNIEGLNIDDFADAIRDVINGNDLKVEHREAQQIVQNYFAEQEKKLQAERAEKGKAAKEAGEKYLAENAKKEGIITTASGLQYKVLKEGTGKQPKATDKVRCHYEGFLIDGVIVGWTEGLQLMREGGKYRFFIPYKLGYGEGGAGASIPPFATLVFDVELLEVL